MSILEEIKVSYFESVYKTTPLNDGTTLMEILDEIRDPKPELKDIISKIRSTTDHTERTSLKKKNLPAFTASGVFSTRYQAGLVECSGALCIDLDHLDSSAIEATRIRLKKYSFVAATFVSPSGEGLKVIVLHNITGPSLLPYVHKSLYRYIGNKLEVNADSSLDLDTSPSNVASACFMSYDKDIYINDEAVPLNIDSSLLADERLESIHKEAKDSLPKAKEETKLLTDSNEIKKAIVEIHSNYEERHSAYTGNRNDTVFQLSRDFAKVGVPIEFTKDYLIAYYADKKNGFTSDEILRTIESAYKI